MYLADTLKESHCKLNNFYLFGNLKGNCVWWSSGATFIKVKWYYKGEEVYEGNQLLVLRPLFDLISGQSCVRQEQKLAFIQFYWV